MAAQMMLASEQFARAVQRSSQMFARLVEAEAQWAEQVRSDAANVTRLWVPYVGDSAPSSANRGSQEAADLSPLALLGGAQTAWTQLSQQWTEAVGRAVLH